MPERFWIIAIALLLCGNGARVCCAAQAPASGTNAFISWNTERGDGLLPQSSVLAMTQTRDGYLWLGTMKGLVRFDGMKAEVFDALGSMTIVFLFEDSRGGLWVGTEKNGVVMIRDGELKVVTSAEGMTTRLVSACEDASGAVWLCAEDGRLTRYRDGVKENEWPPEVAGARLYRAIVAEKSGEIWVASSASLSRVVSDVHSKNFSLEVQRMVLPRGRLDFIAASKTGGCWRFCDGRVELVTAHGTVRDLGAYQWSQSATPVQAVCEDAEGNLFVGTYGDGVFRYGRDGSVTHISSPADLNHSGVLSLWVDREGWLWVGTNGGGLNRVRPSMFMLHPDAAGKTVQSVSEDASGGLWIGLNGDNVNTDAVRYWKDGAMKQFGPAQGMSNPFVRAVLVDSRQTVWAGGISQGGVFQMSNGRFQLVPGTDGLQVSALFEDRATNLWVGAENGLVRWDGKVWRGYTVRDGLPGNAVRALADDANGNLWIGTDGGGLLRLQNGTFTRFRQSAGGLPGDSVTALLMDAEGVLWVGTSGGGLGRYADGKWTRYTTHEGLAGNSITYLIEDGFGSMWIGSNEGLMRVEKSALNLFAGARDEAKANGIHVRTFRKADGLPTKECTTGSQPAACRTRDGRLWFPTTTGLVGVNPAQLVRNTNPPPVHIESVLVDGESQGGNPFQVSWEQDIVIPASKESLDIHFTGLNLASQERVRFKYLLEGHESKWKDSEGMRTVRFPKLPPGRYRFLVKASNEDGVWSPQPAAVSIEVLPPFWKTWWFQTTIVLALVGLIIGIVYFISTQKLSRQLALLRQQEALEKERSRIARDLHDQLGANLTQVALLGEMVEADKEMPTEVEGYAQQISRTARETSTALDEIVWAANPSNDTLEGLVTYACKYAQDYLALAGLRYRLDVPAQLPESNIAPDLRHNVFLAFKESVNNVVKHAKATEVKIRVRLEANKFTIEIEDDGRGPGDAPKKTGRNGLRNMRKRMEDVGGKFTMTAGAERGTIVRLASPITKR